MDLKEITNNPSLLEIGRKAVEDVLIELRDSRISLIGRGNGLVCKEKNGENSNIIRLGTEDAIKIALLAIEQHLNHSCKSV